VSTYLLFDPSVKLSEEFIILLIFGFYKSIFFLKLKYLKMSLFCSKLKNPKQAAVELSDNNELKKWIWKMI